MSNDTDTGWAVAGAFLEAFAGRDFDALAQCLDPDIRFRALIPPGAIDVTGVDDTVGRFRHWFGAETFELVDASVGRVGDRVTVHLRNDLPEPTTIHWHGLKVPAAHEVAP